MNKDLKNYDIHSEIGNFLDTIPASLRKESIEEYKKFLQLKILMKDTKTPAILSPCEFVDIVWHTHLLMPIKYSEFCKQVFGQIIDHDLAGSKSSEDEKSLRLERYGIMVCELFKGLLRRVAVVKWLARWVHNPAIRVRSPAVQTRRPRV